MINPRILFMGTPEFACTILQGLIDSKYNVVGLVSQPDRPVGRKHIVEPTPTKKIAIANNIPVYQFDKIRDHLEFLDEVKPELIITCAYGQIVPQKLLDYPKYGCINVHASLLPALRGGAPIHHAIIDGLDETGITIMEMIDKMDAGKIYSTASTKILDSDNLESLSNRLQPLGRDLLLDTLQDYLSGKNKGIPQDESKVTYAWNIKKQEEVINFNQPVRNVFNHIRGISPVPCAHTTLNGKIFKIYEASINEASSLKTPGTIEINNKNFVVYCAQGSLKLHSVQIEGKSKCSVEQFLNGFHEELKEFK